MKEPELKGMIADMLSKHPHLKENDRLLTANVYSTMYPIRYNFHKFVYDLADGEAPTETEILRLKEEILKE